MIYIYPAQSPDDEVEYEHDEWQEAHRVAKQQAMIEKRPWIVREIGKRTVYDQHGQCVGVID